MSFKESDIKHENGGYWVLHDRGVYHVMIIGVTHSVSDSSYSLLDIAIARCDYLARREASSTAAKR